MQSEIDLLRQRVVELEGENVKLKQMIEEHTRHKAESVEVKAELEKNKTATTNLIAENAELRDRVTKLKQKQTPNDAMHRSCRARDQSSLTPRISITTSPSKHKSLEDIETDNFLDMQSKEEVSNMMIKRNREKKLQIQELHSTPLPMSILLIPSEVSIFNIYDGDNSSVLLRSNDTDVPESLDLKTVKKLWDQNQNKSQDKTSQHQFTLSRSHKKKGTENIAQVIVDGIQDNNNLLDESKIRHSLEALPLQSFASSNHVTEISMTALRQNSSTVLLLDLAQLFDKATDAEYSAIKANQEETLCWINYGNEFIIQYNDIIKKSNGKIGEKKAKKISRKTLCKKTQKVIRTYKLFDKIGIDKIKYLKAYSANSISELTNEQIQKIIDNISNHESNIENHMTEISTSAHRQNHTTEIVSTLPETEVSAFSEKLSSEKSSETISEESSASSNPTHDHAYFRNKTLLRYSDLYKAFITEKFDHYGIIEGSLCPVCKLNHDEKNVKGRYEAGSYFIICGKQEIKMTE
ncbi:11128_t:CDS:2 [Cetraspora pellucida]|uniref:11128_t:CDS:1 n=1 Tax=Cetraspora pellucida TaxID=1433469 RepID=A0ACA9MPZ6_9GLOM|nr:11128_t:CDS:2 [Cetraspora pellucida]